MQAPVRGGDTRESLEWLSTEKLLELISHDINNMCHGALSYIDLALDPKLTPEARQKFLVTARQLTHRASRFTPHVRQLTELRADHVAGVPSDPVKKAASEAKQRAMDINHGAPFSLEVKGDAVEARTAGGKYVTEALAHLFDNAVRHAKGNDPVKVVLDASRSEGVVRITVSDNGRGFQRGTEGHAARRFIEPGSVSGAGLGLAFVRLLAERSGGSFAIGKPAAEGASGATVILTLPEAPAA